jgi:hypothetical protein
MNESETPSVLFLVNWVNHAYLLPLQKKLLEKYCRERVDYLAILDLKKDYHYTNIDNPEAWRELVTTCESNGISYIEMPQEFHFERREELFEKFAFPKRDYLTPVFKRFDASARDCAVTQYAWNYARKHKKEYQYICILQSDIIPFQPFSVIEKLGGHSILYQEMPVIFETKPINLYYGWSGFLMMDLLAEPNAPWDLMCFEYGYVRDQYYLDTGGATWILLEKLEKKKKIVSKPVNLVKTDPMFTIFPKVVQEFYERDIQNGYTSSELKDSEFIHLGNISNWYIADDMKNPNYSKELIVKKTEAQLMRILLYHKCCKVLLNA